MNWMPYSSIANAMSKGAIPEAAECDSGHSTPDVYGRAIQFFISLQNAAGKNNFDTEAVRTWRGLITLLALRGFLRLPLYWSRVDLTNEILYNPNLFYQALTKLSRDEERVLFPGQPEWQWDGNVFYVLQWISPGKKPEDLLLYSPFTLVYPVADWQEVFCAVAREEPELARFYKPRLNQGEEIYGFEPVTKPQMLRSAEPQMLLCWLKAMLDCFQTSQAASQGVNQTKAVIQRHLTMFYNDLNAAGYYLNPDHGFRLYDFPPAPANPIMANQIPPPLYSFVHLGQGDAGSQSQAPVAYFADQICYFRTKGANPFHRGCQFPDCYRIEGATDGATWYAFLPIHPERRRECISSGMARTVKMRFGGNSSNQIDVTMRYRSTELGMSYLISDDVYDMRKGRAVPFTEDMLDIGNWPLAAIWPTPIGSAWQKYYLMLEDYGTSTRLEVANLRDMRVPLTDRDMREDLSRDMAYRKSNEYVAQMDYVPEAIPLVKKIPGKDGQVSVGILTPVVEQALEQRSVKAEVAVDFGTSSTRVFARIDGEPDVLELHIMMDEPLGVTEYWETSSDDRGRPKKMIVPSKQRSLADEFIAPNPAEADETDTTLFSMYQKSSHKPLQFVVPMLDGHIYQPSPGENLSKVLKLEVNLKWDMKASEQYYVAFMQQLLLHITVLLYKKYGVRIITWKYALPRSMSGPDQAAVRRIWSGGKNGNDLIRYLRDVCGDTVRHEITEEFLSESVAASRYFLSLPRAVNAKRGYLVVDIGGGSTDVALWQRQDSGHILVWHDSVKVAGRRMFTRWIEESMEDIHKDVNNKELKALIGEFQEAEKSIRGALIDRLMTTYSDEIMAGYRESWKKDGPNGWGARLCGRITQSVTLLMFSLGYQVGVFLKGGEFQVPKDSQYGYFTIAVGGRGSRMLDWLQFRMTVLEDFFREGVRAGQGLEERKVEFQEDPNLSSQDNSQEESSQDENGENPEAEGQIQEPPRKAKVPTGNPVRVRRMDEDPMPEYTPLQRDPKDLLLTDVRINRSADPKCEVGRGLLAHAEQDREPDESSWRNDWSLKIPSDFYLDLADRFSRLYNQLLRRNLRGKVQLTMREFQTAEKNELADRAAEVMRLEPEPNDLFNILMDVIYSYLEQH